MRDRLGSDAARFWAFLSVGVLLFGVLIFRLIQLQILYTDAYREKSDSNRFRILQIQPPRGVMRDREGHLLVTNRSAYSCYGVPRELWNDKSGLALINSVLGYPDGYLENEQIKPLRRTFTPLRLKRDLSFEELSRFEELRNQIPGAFLEMEQKRAYPEGLAAHALGYVSEVSKEELTRFPGVDMGDLVGKRSLERLYDSELRGAKGRRVSVVNAYGQEVGDGQRFVQEVPVPGRELWLTLDRDIQALAESLMVGKIGAVVAMDVRTGGILALASAPAYHPDVFAGRVDPANWTRLMEDPQKPMLNRAVQTMYPPGSTIKPAMLLEGFESRKITPSWSVSCPGSFTFGNRTFKCWKKGGHGGISTISAVEQSCDVFFYKLGLEIGVDGVHSAMTRFHLGQLTGVDQTSEAEGLAPSVAYYNKRYGKSGWTRGFIPSISIGQGEVLVTPLQMCAYTAAIADGRIWRRPHLVQGIFDPATGELNTANSIEEFPLDADPINTAMVRDAMIRVVWGESGTARAQRDDLVKIAGKTGTAQNPHGDDHAWFIGFAPTDNPIIATCVLVEFGEHGSSTAAPISREVMKRFVLKERGELPETAELAEIR